MLDTVRLSVGVPGLSVGDLMRRGWDVHTRTSLDRSDVWGTCQLDGVRVHYGAGFGWLTAEASLPVIVKGDNSLLLSWDDCQKGLGVIRNTCCDAAAFSLPELDDWRVTRFDPVWAWPVDPGPYLGALRFARLPRTQARAYGSSVDWVTRGHRVRARFYDKAVEAGHDVGLPARFERQVRPKREVVRIGGGDRLGNSIAELQPTGLKGLLNDALSGLGLNEPIPSVLALRGSLVDAHGRRRGLNLWRVMLSAREFGGWPGDISKQTLSRYRRQLAQAGIKSFSMNGELPALSLD